MGGKTSPAGKPARREFFCNKTPARVVFNLTRPPIYRNLSDAKLREKIRAEVKRREDELIKQRKKDNRRVLGFKRAASQRYTRLPVRKEEYFKRRPTFSADTDARRQLLARRYLEFCLAYKEAREAWNLAVEEGIGADRVAFPRGTWLLRQQCGVRCSRRPHPV